MNENDASTVKILFGGIVLFLIPVMTLCYLFGAFDDKIHLKDKWYLIPIALIPFLITLILGEGGTHNGPEWGGIVKKKDE